VGSDLGSRVSSGSTVVGARILYVHGIGSIGGAERDLIALLSRLDRGIWHPAIACPGTGSLREVALAQDVPTYSVNLPPWRKVSSLVSRYAAVRRLRKLLADVQPALVHVNDLWWVPHTVRAVAGLSHRIPIIAHVRQEAQPRKVSQYALDRVDYVVAVSHQVKQGLLTGGVSPNRVRTLYSGVDCSGMVSSEGNHDIRAQHGIPREALLIGTIANLLPLKGYEVMLDALPTILAAMPTVHYLAIGGGGAEYCARLKAITVERGIAERVHFAGFQESVGSYLSALDLYVHPSLKEAFGLAVVEAMAMGKAVVATTVGGLPEVVAQGETGLLVPSGDAESLAETVVSLLQDPVRRERMGRNGKARVQEQFSLDVSIMQMEQLYGEVLRRG
jgi:glycosyltransferase involved in cell wall biosynthesis